MPKASTWQKVTSWLSHGERHSAISACYMKNKLLAINEERVSTCSHSISIINNNCNSCFVNCLSFQLNLHF